MDKIVYTNPRFIEIEVGRWDVNITIVDVEGKSHRFVCSADSGLTFNDGIFFGTPKEYRETLGL